MGCSKSYGSVLYMQCEYMDLIVEKRVHLSLIKELFYSVMVKGGKWFPETLFVNAELNESV